MRALVFSAALLATAAPIALAQDAEEDRDRGFLVGLIEDNLSAPGLSVRLDGFEGALSSVATLDRLAVSDDAGTWLVLEDVALDWNRSALLRGRLEVEELSAGLIRLERTPLPPEGVEALPEPGASGFSLPDLPVSVDVERLLAERIELGEALMGQAAAFTLEASARLADASGAATLAARRLDGPAGTFTLDASFDAATEALAIELAVSEAEGGLAATLLGLPGEPAVDLTVEGEGPLDDFAAEIALASNGQDRLAGDVSLTGTEAGRVVAVDLSGDVTPLFAPEYRDFFGEDVRIAARAVTLEEGGTDIETLRIAMQALTLEGAARLGADGWPTFLDLQGVIAAPDGGLVPLPTADAATLAGADLTLAYDAAAGEDWTLALSLRGYDGAAAELETARIEAEGIIDREGGTVTGATAALRSTLEGLDLTDPDMAGAVGPRIDLTADVGWAEERPVRIEALDLAGDGYALAGTAEIETGEDGLLLRPDLDLVAQDLSRFAALTGLDLSGRAEVALDGRIAPLAGTFDITIGAATETLTLGIPQADALLAGRTTLSTEARRGTDGTFLDALDLTNDRLSVTGSAALLTEAARTEGATGFADLDIRLEDGAALDPRLDGPVTLTADIEQDGDGVWTGQVEAAAPQGISATAAGTLTGPAPAVAFTANVPDLSPFAPDVPGGMALEGRAFARNGTWALDAEAEGPWDLTASVEGPVTGPNAAIAFEARLPDLSDPVPGVEAVPALSGPVTLDGMLRRDDAAWTLDARAAAPAGVTLRARGPVTGPAARIDIAATLPEIAPVLPDGVELPGGVEGPVSLDATLARDGEDWAADLVARGPADIRVTAAAIPTRTPLRATFAAEVPRLEAVAPGVPDGLDVSGELRQTSDGWDVDLGGTGPYSAEFDASATLAETGPAISVTGRIPETGALAPQLSGPLEIAARASQTGGAWRVDATAEGAQSLSIAIDGIATGPSADLAFRASAADVAPFVPNVSGPLDAEGRLFRRDETWAIDLAADGPLGATLSADGTLTGATPSATFDLAVPDLGPILPELRGPLRITGDAARQGQDWSIDVDAEGPSGTQADIEGSVGTGGAVDLSATGSAPLGLVNPFIAPRLLTGVARFDLALDGPASLDALTGTITTDGATLALPTLRNGFEDIEATVDLTGARAQIDLTAEPETGGRIAVTGPITLSAPFTADLGIDIDARLADPSLYTTEIEGDLRISGPLAGRAAITGDLTLDGAEIRVPSSGLTAIGDLPPIEHVATPRPVRRTLARAGQLDIADGNGDGVGGGGPGYLLDLTIAAPDRIFVRGRGLDAELGGRLRLTGTTANPVTAGGFELIRGRLDLLDQRFDLDEGAITFQGDPTPNIRLVAVTETDTLTASIIVEGPADDIDVRFESSPDVPEEEILAQIFFGRDLSQLSALQALQLANSVAVLSGRGSGGLLNNIRGEAGLDDLDITTDEDGNAAVRAGAYLTDNVYADVQVDQEGQAEVTLNLDLTDDVTVRGSTAAEGTTSLGIFFERDY
jgi:translocation and assembly module TamB